MGSCQVGTGGILAVSDSGIPEARNPGTTWSAMETEWNRLEWNGTERHEMEWNGMERSDVERNGMEWNGMERNGTEWNGMVRME